MATIDLIVLGIVKQEALSAYAIQQLVEYRNISKWVKISDSSIYKKVLKLEEKGYIKGSEMKGERRGEKSVYSLTPLGEEEFNRLMLDVSSEPVNIFLNFNAVVVNLESLSAENQKKCIENIEHSIRILKEYIEDNIKTKANILDIPETGRAVLQQQFILVEAIEKWLNSIKKPFKENM